MVKEFYLMLMAKYYMKDIGRKIFFTEKEKSTIQKTSFMMGISSEENEMEKEYTKDQ